MNRIDHVTLTGGLIGLFSSPYKTLNAKTTAWQSEGFEAVQILPDDGGNLTVKILRMLLLIVTVFIYTRASGYYVVLRKQAILGDSQQKVPQSISATIGDHPARQGVFLQIAGALSVVAFVVLGTIGVKKLRTHDPINFGVSASGNVPASGGFTYYASNLQDKDLKTSWQISGGVGQWFQMDFPKPSRIRLLKIANGFQWRNHPEYGDLLIKNARIKTAAVLVNGKVLRTIAFAQVADGYEEFSVDANDVSSLRVSITDVWPGTQWQDLSVSEVQVE